ncbi:hypothetical protein KYC5002_19760 [Archangium violaceum]|uniref:hypothetical protein n=1 Tax=Archangium violaceum TaxID=83451 RepID=UPI002B2C4554|nr:hypothetical protein KYC5002_19760 [Archangium gephyra]
MRDIGQELLNVPMGDMIREMALAIADAQLELDKSSMLVAEMMSGEALLRDADGNVLTEKDPSTGQQVPQKVRTTVNFAGEQTSMMALGFNPTFYQFVDTIIEVKIAVKMTESTTSSISSKTQTTRNAVTGLRTLFKRPGAVQAVVSTVDASYTRKYDYSAEGSSLLRTKLVPVPPPAILEERIRDVIAQKRAAAESSSSTVTPTK